MKIGMIFPGQGSQFLGMGKEFFDNERLVQELFDQASSCLDQNLVRLCFASSEKELCQTTNAQTAIFLVSVSIYSILKEKYDVVPHIVAGHSLGEYAAIFAAGGITFPDALYLLKKRSSFMQEATMNQEGGMLAVLKMPEARVKQICSFYDQPDGIERVAQIVNFNCPDQVVVSGTLPELELIKADIKSEKGKVIPLKVAGAFHSRMMKQPEANFSAYMPKVDLKDLQIPFVNNVKSEIITKHEDVKNSLISQISAPVLWWPSMQHFKEMDLIIQIGPGDKLAKMLASEWPDKKIVSVNNYAEMEHLLNLLGKKMEIILPDDNVAQDSQPTS